jgi:hypothetical protein
MTIIVNQLNERICETFVTARRTDKKEKKKSSYIRKSRREVAKSYGLLLYD